MPGDSAAERAFYFFPCGIARLVYRVKAIGVENLPSGGFLLVPNHITWVDAIILHLACPRPVRFVIDVVFYRKPVLKPVLLMALVLQVELSQLRELTQHAHEHIA